MLYILWTHFTIGQADSINGSIRDNQDSNTSILPLNTNLDETAIASEGEKFSMRIYNHAYLDTIDTTNRAGKYLSTATITVSTL